MHVQVAADVANGDEVGELPPLGNRDLATALAELRRDPWQPDRLVDAFLRVARHGRAARLPLLVELEHAVLVHREATVPRPGPQLHVVLLRPGEVLDRRPEGGFGNDPQIDLHPLRPADAHLRVAAEEHGGRPLPRGESVHDRRSVVRHHDDVEIADRLPPAPQAPCRLDLPAARLGLQVGDRSVGDRLRVAPQQPLVLGALRKRDVLEDRRLGLLAEALDLPHPSLPAGRLERVERIDAQPVHEQLRLLGTQAGHPHDREGGRRHRGGEFVQQGQAAGVEERRDLRREVGTDSLDVGQAPLRILAD